MTRFKQLLVLVFAVCLLGCLTACAPLEEDDNSSSEGGGALTNSGQSAGDMDCVVVYAQHANSKALPAGADEYIRGVKEAQGYLNFVRLDGSPVSFGPGKTSNEHENQERIRRENDAFVEDNMVLLQNAKAEEPEVDLVGAIKEANDDLDSTDDALENVVVIVGTGLSTKGAVDFTSFSLGSDDLSEYASWIKEQGLLTDDSLGNIDRIVWYGFDEVAEPQEDFPTTALEEETKNFYTTLLTSAGVGSVEFKKSEREENPEDSLPEVTMVKMPKAPLYKAGSTETVSADELYFKPDSAEIKDGKNLADNATIKTIAKSLKQDKNLKLVIEGFTANEGSSYDAQELRQSRAQKVRDALVEMGCSDANITAKAGDGYPYGEGTQGKEEDIDKKNRCVKFTFE